MIEAINGLFTGLGLSSSAGLNAYLPLLIVAVVARFTDWITLSKPWSALTNGWIIALLAVLLGPVVTAATGGVGNPIVSTIEDISSALVALLSILIPTLVALLLLLLFIVLSSWYWRRRRARTI
ncbi:MAG: hypothetical protein B6I34_07185 [Anaerolineaceae bacterium 4572_32.1]|nr:MAG: hypothetical protein B6I34_07185 [Anaerolineaceae bacterium 4572_32.1]